MSDNKNVYPGNPKVEKPEETFKVLCNSIKNNNINKVNDYTMRIISDLITNNFLKKWCNDYNEVEVKLSNTNGCHIEFVVPKFNSDFIERFINGRETMDGYLHRSNKIKIKISKEVFGTIIDGDDLLNFFKSAIKYYSKDINSIANKLHHEILNLKHDFKHLIVNTKLIGLVTLPMILLFNFDNINMSKSDNFHVDKDDIDTINNYVKTYYRDPYISDKTEQNKIIDNLKGIIKSFHENCDVHSENIKAILNLDEAVQELYDGKYNAIIKKSNDMFIESCVDRSPVNKQLQYMREAAGMKKLKKIPNDLIAYISIETEAIKTTNDKMMIASYCLGKLEIVEWYIELIDVGSNKYIVPHTKQYLEIVHTQLLACYKRIMDVKIINPGNRPIIDINYPKGYEG